MRILLLATDIYGGHGGIALYNRDLVSALAAMDRCQEVVVVPRVIPRSDQHTAVPPKTRFIAEAAGGGLAYARTLLGLARERFDLVICGHMNLLPAARLVSRHPMLLTYGIEAWRPNPRFLADRLVHHCREVVSISRITRDRLLAWSNYRGPTWLLPNAVHAGDFGIRPRNAELARRYGVEGRRVLLTVGRLVSSERYKGFDEVLEILPRLPEDVVYIIAGSGNDSQRLEASAAAHGVRDRVIMTGDFDEREKPDLYSLADVYVMPSRGEGFGFVFLEAMASGIPVIASRHDGGRDALLDGELGLLVDPSSPGEIEAAIREALTHPRRMPEGLDHFSFERFAERVADIVDAALRAR